MLPAAVVSSLCRVRDAENGTDQWKKWCFYLDTQARDMPQMLPPFDETRQRVMDRVVDNLGTTTTDDDDDDDNGGAKMYEPSVSSLKEEIKKQLLHRADGNDGIIDSLVFSGEGEPTLRWDCLLALADEFSGMVPMRLTTNGLLADETTKTNNDADTQSVPSVQELQSTGIRSVSVSLMTADPGQYVDWMEPVRPDHNLDTVCSFIRDAVEADLAVELTGVDRPDVDKQKAEELSASLGVKGSIRWRPYFP